MGDGNWSGDGVRERNWRGDGERGLELEQGLGCGTGMWDRNWSGAWVGVRERGRGEGPERGWDAGLEMERDAG